jgi:ArsR family transcriptional regulator
MDAAESTAADPASTPLDRSAAEHLARTLRAVADPTRLQVLSLLNAAPAGEAVVGDLAAALELRQPTVSHHLRIMFEDGLLTREQRGRQVFYAIAPARRDEIADLLR